MVASRDSTLHSKLFKDCTVYSVHSTQFFLRVPPSRSVQDWYLFNKKALEADLVQDCFFLYLLLLKSSQQAELLAPFLPPFCHLKLFLKNEKRDPRDEERERERGRER